MHSCTALRRFRPVLLFASAVVVGCADRASLPVGADTPRYNFTNGPASPGPYIVRIENTGSRVITTDPETGLFAIHGKIKNLSECTNATTRVPVDIQIVRTPSDAQGMALLLTAKENDVAIFDQGNVGDLSPFDPVTFCAFINNVVPAYEGVVNYALHINGQGSQNFAWEGPVTRLSDGVEVPYVERQHFVATGNGTGDWVIEEIRVR